MTNPVHVVIEKFYRCRNCYMEQESPTSHCPELEELLPGWYFWDETWGYRHGPFATYSEANSACEKYVKTLDAERCSCDDIGEGPCAVHTKCAMCEVEPSYCYAEDDKTPLCRECAK